MIDNFEILPEEYFKKVEELKQDGFEMMVDLTAVDWFRKKDPRFELVVNFLSVSKNKRVCLSVKLNDDLTIPSIVSLYPSANFYEREAFDMFGINFENHPNLEKLYLPDGYEGNPMLKSFELISREVKPWPGEVDVEGMPEESESDKS